MAQANKVNDNLIMIVGKSATGKSASLMGIENPDGVIYANCEAGKKLPFKSKFKEFVITDPYQLFEMFDWAERPEQAKYHTIVIDTQTYLMDMFESVHVIGSANSQQQWGAYAQFFQNLMQQYVARCSKNVIFLAHTVDEHNATDMIMETKVPVKGALKGKGIESFFNQVVATKKMSIKDLAPYDNPLLIITDRERALGYKHVFQVNLTKDTVGERLRGPMGMWDDKETFIDNNVQFLLNRLHEYYG
jgi:hypothetical protein